MDFLNKNYKSYLNKNEKVLLHMQQAKEFAFPYVLGRFIIAFLTFSLFTLWGMAQLETKVENFPVLTISFVSLFIAIVFYFKYKCVHYMITESGIYKISGLLNKKIKFVSYKKITDNSLSINIFEAMFDVGTINISTAGGTRSYSGNSQPYELVIRHVNDYNKTSKLITKHL